MQLLYNFPDALIPYFEFIPETELQKILTVALEQSVLNRSTTYGSNSEQDKSYEKLLLKIQEMLETTSRQVAVTAPLAIVPKPRPVRDVPPPVVEWSAEESGDAELDFLADILK